jgi:mycofactocin precursor
MTVTTEDNPNPSAGATPAPGGVDRASGTPTPAGERAVEAVAEDLVEEDLLVEDVSIDGMCGVY